MYSRRLTQKIEAGDDNENKGILKYFSIFIASLSFLALLSILLIQFFLSYSQIVPTIFTPNNPFIMFATFIIFAGLQFLIYKIINFIKIPTRKLHHILLGFTFVIGVLVSVIFFSPPYSDVWSVMNGFSVDNWITVAYTNYYPNNMGLALLYQVIFSVLGRQSWIIMYMVNIISVMGIFYVLPKLSSIIGNEKAERISIQILFFALPFSFMVTYLYNDLISLYLVLQSILFLVEFMRSKQIKNSKIILSGLLLGVAYILRTNIIIFAIGIFIYVVLYIIKNKNFNYKSFLSFLPLVIMIIMQLIFKASIPSLVPSYNKEEAQPAISWIAMSLADEQSMKDYGLKKPGLFFSGFELWAFNEYKKENKDATKHDYIIDRNFRKKIYSDFIGSRINDMTKHPQKAIKYYAQKEAASWADPSFGTEKLLKDSYDNQKNLYDTLPFESIAKIQGIQSTSANKYINNREKFQSTSAIKLVENKYFLNYVERPFLILILVGSIFNIIKSRKRLVLEELLLLVIFIGGFIFHEFIWETQPRYMLAYFALLIPLAANGIKQLLSIKKRTS